MQLASRLHAAIETVCPIAGVRIGKRDDKETWQIAFAENATEEQRAAALDVIAGFDAGAPDNLLSPPASVTDELAALKAALIADGIITEAKLEAASRGYRRRSI
jgi:hypothetical protein